jgi:hypothetical protein
VGTGSVEVSGAGAGKIKPEELGSPLSRGAGVVGGAIPQNTPHTPVCQARGSTVLSNSFFCIESCTEATYSTLICNIKTFKVQIIV